MSNLKVAVNENDHIQGDINAKVVVVEYGDYQCGHCAHAHEVLKNMVDKFDGQVALVFRNFPLSQMHEMALPAAIAAEAAANQGKFWEMNNALYENQQSLGSDLYMQLAKDLGLDEKDFAADLQDKALQRKVEDDFEGGVRSGVNGTPSFFVNGNKFDGGPEDLLQMLNDSTQ